MLRIKPEVIAAVSPARPVGQPSQTPSKKKPVQRLIPRIVATSLCLLLALAAAPMRTRAGQGAGPWTRVTSKNFTLVGDAEEAELRRMARRLEEFRQALARLFPDFRVDSHAPTTVVVFKSYELYEGFRPMGDASGYFKAGEDGNYIALTASRRDEDDALKTLRHEYVHLLVNDNLPRAPLWLSEGLAEVYAALEVAGERRLTVGRALDRHVRLLRTQTLLPLSTLLTVDHSSPHYVEASKREVFYAQSWALVHYLLFGREGRGGATALRRFTESLGRGQSAAESLRAAFGASPEEIEHGLSFYVGRAAFPSQTLTLGERLKFDAQTRAEKLSAAETSARLGDLLLHLDRQAESETHLRRALMLDARLASARVSLGMLRLRQSRLEEARAEFAAAVAGGAADHRAHYHYALSIIHARAGTNASGGHLPETEDLLRAQLLRAIELAPRYADAYDLLAHVELGAGDLERAASLLKRASELAPARADRYSLTLAQVHAHRGDLEGARRLLNAVAREGSEAALRERAGELLKAVDRQEESESRRAGAGGGEEMATELPSVYSVRAKAEGEEQARGDLVTVECAAEEVFLHLLVEGRTLRFRARNFERLPFVSYDPAMARGRDRKLTCGTRAAANHVLLTYRPASDAGVEAAGEVVAVDFVPREWK